MTGALVARRVPAYPSYEPLEHNQSHNAKNAPEMFIIRFDDGPLYDFILHHQ